ncbi:pkb-activating kinase-like protein [Gryganskiella cystojenkinii]|nr:pkb-activating kinase-like protein [Gryganskiella cystojenkinii]
MLGVVAAVDLSNRRDYAIKVLDKRHIIREKKVKYVNIEKDTLYKLDHPGVVKLYSTFQDSSSLYYVLELCQNGELLTFIKKLGSFDENCTRFYAAQILTAVEYIHSQGVIHRDLKPENILLDHRMYVKLTDFGTAKMLETTEDGPNSDRANSFVGTAEYVSPELLTEKAACKSSDLWALGCIIYQLLAGRPPFKGSNEYQTFQKIVKLEYAFPLGFPSLAQDLVSKLLIHDPNERLGANNQIDQLKQHPFFEGIEWTTLWKQPAPTLQPYIPPTEQQQQAVTASSSPSSPDPVPQQIGGGLANIGALGESLDVVDPFREPSNHHAHHNGNSHDHHQYHHNGDAGVPAGGTNGTTMSSSTNGDSMTSNGGSAHTPSSQDSHHNNNTNGTSTPKSNPASPKMNGNSNGNGNSKTSGSGRSSNPVLRWFNKISKGSKDKKNKKTSSSKGKTGRVLEVEAEENGKLA